MRRDTPASSQPKEAAGSVHKNQTSAVLMFQKA